MSEKIIHLGNVQGLSAREVPVLQQQYGKNIFHVESSRGFFDIVWDIVKEPVKESIMLQTPRERNRGLFAKEELLISVVQGIIIATGVMVLYYYFMENGADLKQIRNIVFTSLILSNIFLTFANCSFTKTIFYTIRYKNNLAPFIIIVSAGFLAAIHFIPGIRNLFQLAVIGPGQFLLCAGVAFAGVMWFEVYKTDLMKLKS
jgi:P-type Ca2+ transporter type 2C